MTRSTGKRKHHFKDVQPADPAVKSFSQWPAANQTFYAQFRCWLHDGGYGDSALHIYGCAARLALGWLDKPYWEIDPTADMDRVRAYVNEHYAKASTRSGHMKGLAKLAEFLRVKCCKAPQRRPVNWDTYVGSLPQWLADDVRAYVAHRRRSWLPEMQHRATITCLSHLTISLRWMAAHSTLADATAITPSLWYDHVDARLADGISPVTINIHQHAVQNFLRFLAEQGRSICERMLRVEPLDQGEHLPRDVSIEQLRRLQRQIETQAGVADARKRRLGPMDLSWFLLMLHSGLRTGEIRRLRRSDLELNKKQLRVIQSKGLKDRIVFVTQAAVETLNTYLDVRGSANSDHVFIYRHRALSVTYCSKRLRTYGERCGVKITAHQLRHSCATLLLNAGAPVLAVQRLLGHKYVDTTLGYARLYDSTVAADYYRAMGEIEQHSKLNQDLPDSPPSSGEMLALLDALRVGTLNETQQEIVRMLRTAILEIDMNKAPDDSFHLKGN